MMFFGGGMLFFGLLVLVAIIVAVGGLGDSSTASARGLIRLRNSPRPGLPKIFYVIDMPVARSARKSISRCRQRLNCNERVS